MERIIGAKVSKEIGGNGFDGPRKEIFKRVYVVEGRYETGDRVLEGQGEGWYIDEFEPIKPRSTS